MCLRKSIMVLTAITSIVLPPTLINAEPPAFIKSLHNLQGIRYPSDFREEISKTPKGITQDFLRINKKAHLINKDYLLWLDFELPEQVQPSFANEICKKYGGTFYSLRYNHPVTGDRATYDQLASMNAETVGTYVCEDKDKKPVFTMEMRLKSSQHFKGTGNTRQYGDVLVKINSLDGFDVKEYPDNKEFSEKVGDLDMSTFISKKGFFDSADISIIDGNTIQRMEPITISAGPGGHLTTKAVWSELLALKVPQYCLIKGGELYKIHESELMPFARVLLETILPGMGMYPQIKGDYVCMGGKEQFLMKITDVVALYSIPHAKTYFSKLIPEKVASMPIYGSPGSKVGIAQTASQEEPGLTAGGQDEQLALDVAARKTNVLKVSGVQQYTGLYNGTDSNGCDLVTIEKNWDSTLPKPRIDTSNYRVCNGKISNISDTMVENAPKGIDPFIKLVAKVAQKKGSAEMDYQGYQLKAQALRDKDKCRVEVKILKGINLIEIREIDGCTN